jgi:hypothetical protein
MRMARFGKNVVFQTDWQPDEFAAMQKRVAGEYDGIVREIDELVELVAARVARLPTLRLLQRAWGEMAVKSIAIEAEVDVDQDDAVAMRMIDYVQSIAASVPPAADQAAEVSDEEWAGLRQEIERLFSLINNRYQISSTIKRQLEGTNYDEQTEEFRYRAQIYWANVRGQRHYAHQLLAVRDLLSDQSTILEKAFGITADNLLIELEKVWHSLIFGMGEALSELKEIQEAALEAFEADIAAGVIEGDEDSLLRETMDRHGLSERAASAAGRFVGLDLFDLGKVTNLPPELLDTLSWSAGEDIEFMSEGPMRGWPLRIWPTFKRPFIKIEGRHYCFDLHSLFDHVYRAVERVIFAKHPALKQQWISNRKTISEDLPRKYLTRLLAGAEDYGEIYYPNGPRKSDGWSELDRLIAYDDHLIVIEVKSGSFTYTSPADDFDAHVASLRALIEDPARQAKRFLEYLESADEVLLYDRHKNEVARVRRDRYRVVTVCAISVDPFTEFAAQARHLSKLGLEGLDRPVWALSVDDLRVFADVFETPIEFLHFVEQRTRAFDSDLLQLDDELDHVGLYLAHNNYVQHAEEMVGDKSVRFNVLGYRTELDRFYSQKLADPTATSPLSQDMPVRMREAISWLNANGGTGRVRKGALLLDLDGDTRSHLFDGVEGQLERMRTGKPPQVVSSFGELRVTLFPSAPPISPTKHDEAVEFTRTVMASHDESDRLLLEPVYLDAKRLIGFEFTSVSNVLLSEGEQARMAVQGQRLRRERVRRAGSSVGRNDPCPCGSGKKYKKCCLN